MNTMVQKFFGYAGTRVLGELCLPSRSEIGKHVNMHSVYVTICITVACSVGQDRWMSKRQFALGLPLTSPWIPGLLLLAVLLCIVSIFSFDSFCPELHPCIPQMFPYFISITPEAFLTSVSSDTVSFHFGTL